MELKASNNVFLVFMSHAKININFKMGRKEVTFVQSVIHQGCPNLLLLLVNAGIFSMKNVSKIDFKQDG